MFIHFGLDMLNSLINIGVGVLDPGEEIIGFYCGCGLFEQLYECSFEAFAVPKRTTESISLKLAFSSENK